jgi:hypothetical protein
MKSLSLWSVVLVLTAGNLIGCSRTSRKTSDASAGLLAARGAAESRQAKPSPCIKWDSGSARSIKPRRKANGAAIARGQQYPPANAENRSHT